MANRNFEQQILTIGKRRVKLDFTIVPNGTSTPTIVGDTQKAVQSISRQGVGTYTITLKDSYKTLIAVQFGFQLNAAAATLAVVTGATDVVTAKTIPFTILQESAGTFAAADIAANANNRIGVSITLSDSTVGT
jgi:hypothetical protein